MQRWKQSPVRGQSRTLARRAWSLAARRHRLYSTDSHLCHRPQRRRLSVATIFSVDTVVKAALQSYYSAPAVAACLTATRNARKLRGKATRCSVSHRSNSQHQQDRGVRGEARAAAAHLGSAGGVWSWRDCGRQGKTWVFAGYEVERALKLLCACFTLVAVLCCY